MRKLLAIIVLGLLWSNSSSAKLGDSYYNEFNDSCLELNKGDLGKKFCKCYINELDNKFDDFTLTDVSTDKKERKIIKGFKDAKKLCQKQELGKVLGKKDTKKHLKQSLEYDLKKNTRKVTAESILNKYKSTLPDCNNGITAVLGDTKMMTWNNCFGKVKVKMPGQEYITIESEFNDSNTGFEIITAGPKNEINPGTKYFKILTKNGCKKKGHAIGPDGAIYNIKWNQKCDDVKKMTFLYNNE